MLLAMVVMVIGGVFVLLGPFLEDIGDNREWSAGSVAATQLNDRILVAAQSPEGTGLVQQNVQLSRSMTPLRDVEAWTIQADIGGSDRTLVSLEGNFVTVSSLNKTASIVSVTDDNGTQYYNLVDGSGSFTVDDFLVGNVIIEVEDIHGTISHRFIQISLDGIRLNNELSKGNFEVDLINSGRIETLPGKSIDVRQFPRLRNDILLDGSSRVTLILLDIEISASASRQMTNVHIDSNGQVNLFNQVARNLILEFDISGDPSIAPQYMHHWTGDYELYLAGGTLDEYHDFGPHGRLSGLDGMTLYPKNKPFEFVVTLQSVEVY